MVMGGSFIVHVGFQNPMFYNKKVKRVKVLVLISNGMIPTIINNGDGERDG
jgi:hypothetical protein